MTKQLGKPLKSLILAAGYGTRLKPLTDVIPKPLTTVCGVPLLDAALARAKLAGATAFAVNSHHLHELILNRLKECGVGITGTEVFVSHEGREILGTGGALVALEDWWDDSPLLVYNGDILSDMALDQLSAAHHASKAIVTMAVRPAAPKDGGRSVWVDQNWEVRAICLKKDLPDALQLAAENPNGIGTNHLGQLREFGFACAYVTEPGLRAFLPKAAQFFDVISAFQAAIAQGQKLLAVSFDGFWADVGNPKSLWKANLDVAQMPPEARTRILGAGFSDKVLGYGPCNVVSREAEIHPKATMTNCVLLGSATVGASESLVNHIRGWGLDQSF